VFINKLDSSEHYAITKGKFFKNKSVRVRVISTNILKNITNFKKNTFDLIISSMFLHETSTKAIKKLLRNGCL